ncbi:hypothetical protein A2Y85_02460 [candidate division WOR-3 bacterium RBG_13_43_14]|uniref:CN hydrolase domain-containing protein n=1 Tax=candidate division WOR-3 bacterium RBG_13_43_14 TaxID=1802590 RepID=A0A1F4U435_UNCW3|nr:MAG: hypothetical protein A2Y85_02460 [candidate division WOR-3 bacterium RBG_13_43_14]
MKIGFVQFAPVFGDRNANLNTVARLIEGCSADLLLIPELFSTGYTFASHKELLSLAEPVTGPTFEALLQLCKKKSICLAYGYAEKDNDVIYNSMAMIDPNGLIGNYRKIHLFWDEKDLFAPGNNGFQVLEYEGTKYGLMICFDWIYPESARTLALRGAQVILHPSNLVLPYCPDAMVTRAIENRVYTVTANRIGEESRAGKNYAFIGMSEIVAPDGKILCRAQKEECCQVVDIEPGIALNKKVTPRNDLLADRHVKYYQH